MEGGTDGSELWGVGGANGIVWEGLFPPGALLCTFCPTAQQGAGPTGWVVPFAPVHSQARVGLFLAGRSALAQQEPT